MRFNDEHFMNVQNGSRCISWWTKLVNTWTPSTVVTTDASAWSVSYRCYYCCSAFRVCAVALKLWRASYDVYRQTCVWCGACRPSGPWPLPGPAEIGSPLPHAVSLRSSIIFQTQTTWNYAIPKMCGFAALCAVCSWWHHSCQCALVRIS